MGEELREDLIHAADPRVSIGRFAVFLRDQGFIVGLAETALMMRVAAEVPLTEWRMLSRLWRSAVCGNRQEWERFPALFDAFWFPRCSGGTVRVVGTPMSCRSLPERVAALHRELETSGKNAEQRHPGWVGGQAATETDESERAPRAMGGASRRDLMQDRPFAEWLPEDFARIDAAVVAFARRLRRLLLRRRERAPTGFVDLRASLRAARGTAGEIIRLATKRRQRREPRIAVMVDVSRSMERHVPLFLRVARVFDERCDARVFLFHTRLACVGAMWHRSGRRMQEKIAAMSMGFGGGTRIASTVDEALSGPLRRLMGRHDVLLLCSDGFDADPPQRLAEVLTQAKGRGIEIVWLHPTREAPASQAVRTAVDAVRAFIPVHDLESLARLPTKI